MGTGDEYQGERAKAALALQRIGTEEATDALIKHLNTARWCPLTNKDSQY